MRRPGKLILQSLGGVISNRASGKMMEFPVFGPKYWNFFNMRADNEKKTAYQSIPKYSGPNEDDVSDEDLEPSWLIKAISNFKDYLHRDPAESRSVLRTKIAHSVADRDAVGRLNFRHVLRGA